jgi:hypothetical protein
LPLRYEITNVGTTASSSTLKQVCSTVLSEGGYELRGDQGAIETPVASPRSLTLASTLYPIISIRLKTTPNRLDAIVILTALSIMGITNNASYNWKVAVGAGIQYRLRLPYNTTLQEPAIQLAQDVSLPVVLPMVRTKVLL